MQSSMRRRTRRRNHHELECSCQDRREEVITPVMFVPFAFFDRHQPLKWDDLWAAMCMMGAVYFIFR